MQSEIQSTIHKNSPKHLTDGIQLDELQPEPELNDTTKKVPNPKHNIDKNFANAALSFALSQAAQKKIPDILEKEGITLDQFCKFLPPKDSQTGKSSFLALIHPETGSEDSLCRRVFREVALSFLNHHAEKWIKCSNKLTYKDEMLKAFPRWIEMVQKAQQEKLFPQDNDIDIEQLFELKTNEAGSLAFDSIVSQSTPSQKIHGYQKVQPDCHLDQSRAQVPSISTNKTKPARNLRLRTSEESFKEKKVVMIKRRKARPKTSKEEPEKQNFHGLIKEIMQLKREIKRIAEYTGLEGAQNAQCDRTSNLFLAENKEDSNPLNCSIFRATQNKMELNQTESKSNLFQEHSRSSSKKNQNYFDPFYEQSDSRPDFSNSNDFSLLIDLNYHHEAPIIRPEDLPVYSNEDYFHICPSKRHQKVGFRNESHPI